MVRKSLDLYYVTPTMSPNQGSQVLGRGGLNHSFGPVLNHFGPKLPKTYFCTHILFKTHFLAPICPKLSNTYYGTLICPKHILRHPLVQNCQNHILRKLFVQNCPKNILDTYLSKTYFGTPICPNCPNPILRHIFVQNLFLVPYLSKTTQNLFKDFEGYIEKASNLVLCHQMVRQV